MKLGQTAVNLIGDNAMDRIIMIMNSSINLDEGTVWKIQTVYIC